MADLTVKVANLTAGCPSCGNIIAIEGDMNMEPAGAAQCPQCGAEILIVFTVQCYSLQGVKSNLESLLVQLGLEKDIANYLLDAELDHEEITFNPELQTKISQVMAAIGLQNDFVNYLKEINAGPGDGTGQVIPITQGQ